MYLQYYKYYSTGTKVGVAWLGQLCKTDSDKQGKIFELAI